MWVLTWRYRDGSASGVVRAYKLEATAHADREMMTKHADGKEWVVEEVPYVGY